MSRIVSVWLPRWPILRLLAAQAKNPSRASQLMPDRPFVLAVAAAGGPRIAALNEAAEAAGLATRRAVGRRAGESGIFAGARRRCRRRRCRAAPAGVVGDALHADRLAVGRGERRRRFFPRHRRRRASVRRRGKAASPILLRGCEKFRPAGAACRRRHARRGLGAVALSRRARVAFCPRVRKPRRLRRLPIEALRLSPETRTTLRRLGFKSVGALLDKPRAPFAARFPAELLRRLDQALGRVDEPLVPVVAPPVYHSLRYLLEPIVTQEAIVALASRLMQTLVHVLDARRCRRARAAAFALSRRRRGRRRIDIGLTLPTRSVAHVARLIDLKLDALAATRRCRLRLRGGRPCRHPRRTDAGAADGTHRPAGRQTATATERCAALIDALRQRLGPHSVRRFEAVASHLPERAEVLPPIDGEAARDRPSQPETKNRRPLLLLPHAEPAEEVTALVPEVRRGVFAGAA